MADVIISTKDISSVALNKIHDDMTNTVCRAALHILVRSAAGAKGYFNFTGHTVTSIVSGMFVDGKLSDDVVVSQDDVQSLKPPVHDKLRKGEYVELMPDYDGRNRGITGSVDIVDSDSVNLAFDNLSEMQKSINTKYAIGISTGTEYSEFLEGIGKNVLTYTMEHTGEKMNELFGRVRKKNAK